MKNPYLEVTYRHGRPIAAYLFLPREPGDTSVRTAQAEPGMIVYFGPDGRAIGIEITAPTKIATADLNRILKSLDAPCVTSEDLAPLKAA